MARLSLRKMIGAALLVSLLICLHPVCRAGPGPLFSSADSIVEPAPLTKCWDYLTAPDLSVTAASDASNIYFVDTDRRLQAVDLALGAKVWSSELAGSVISNLLVTRDAVLVATNTEGSTTTIRAVSRQTGITNWTAELPVLASVFLGSLNGIVAVVASTGSTKALKADSGELLWSKEIGAKVTTVPHFTNSTILLGTDRSEVISIGLKAGEITTVARGGGQPASVFSDTSGRILVGDDRGNLTLSSPEGKRSWRFRNGARISGITGYKSEFLATSHDNFLYKLSRGGNVEWKRRLSGRIGGMASIVGRTALVATIGDGIVYVVDLANGKINYRLGGSEESTAQVVAGGSGFVMLTLGRMTRYSTEGCATNKKTTPLAASF